MGPTWSGSGPGGRTPAGNTRLAAVSLIPNHLHAAQYQPPQQPLTLPVCDRATLETDLAAALVVGWFRVLVSWAQEGRVLDGPVVPRLTEDQAIELCGLLGCIETDEDLAASFADAVGADKSSIQFSRHTKGFCDHPATFNVERVQ
jgi:hypothetical protein